MKTAWIEQAMRYDGSQLRPHWIRRATGLIGDAMVAFRGPCAVRDDEMADLVDLLEGPGIAGDDMVHFLWEVFDDGDLTRAVLRQRLLSAVACETLLRATGNVALRREGDDLYLSERKLSISIATRSLVSTLVHFAVNVTNAGTPVATACLEELGVAPREFAEQLIDAIRREEASIHDARCQVRPKGEPR